MEITKNFITWFKLWISVDGKFLLLFMLTITLISAATISAVSLPYQAAEALCPSGFYKGIEGYCKSLSSSGLGSSYSSCPSGMYKGANGLCKSLSSSGLGSSYSSCPSGWYKGIGGYCKPLSSLGSGSSYSSCPSGMYKSIQGYCKSFGSSILD